MAEKTEVAANAALAPSGADIERAEQFVNDSFLLEGEKPEALAPGTARRRALDAALAELDAGAEAPSISWRREFSLMIGLERLLSMEPPTLNDGAELSEHQVDALSGTLAALIAEQEVAKANGKRSNGAAAAAPAAVETEAEAAAEKPAAGKAATNGATAEDDDAEEDEVEDDALAEEEEPQDWEDEPLAEEDEAL
ncbi:MAG: ribonuclease, partial [Solirubrobacterales bacterium]|nr:ribonuclease [Solirubrobacterales bacterium]